MVKRELPEGHVVRFQHYRYVEIEHSDGVRSASFFSFPENVIREEGLTRLPWGGKTVAQIFAGDPSPETLVAEGVAECSELDNYNRKIGRAIALGRALKTLEEGGGE